MPCATGSLMWRTWKHMRGQRGSTWAGAAAWDGAPFRLHEGLCARIKRPLLEEEHTSLMLPARAQVWGSPALRGLLAVSGVNKSGFREVHSERKAGVQHIHNHTSG